MLRRWDLRVRLAIALSSWMVVISRRRNSWRVFGNPQNSTQNFLNKSYSKSTLLLVPIGAGSLCDKYALEETVLSETTSSRKKNRLASFCFFYWKESWRATVSSLGLSPLKLQSWSKESILTPANSHYNAIPHYSFNKQRLVYLLRCWWIVSSISYLCCNSAFGRCSF